MLILPFPIVVNPYIKKSDVRSRLKYSRQLVSITLFLIIATAWFIQLFVQSRVVSLYQEFNQTLPAITENSSVILGVLSVIAAIIGTYFLLSKPNFKKIDTELASYKNNEMIHVNKIQDFRYDLIIMYFAAVVIGFAVISTVIPLYSLSY